MTTAVLVVVGLAAYGFAARYFVPWLFARFEYVDESVDFDAHTALALAVVAEPSDDFQMWADEIRAARRAEQDAE